MILRPSITIKRTPPKNKSLELNHLIEHELSKTFPASSVHELKNPIISPSGIVYNQDYSIHETTYSSNKTISNRNIIYRSNFLLNRRKELRRSTKTKLSETYIWATDLFSFNFFHWFCDVLPRVFILPEEHRAHTLLLPYTLKKYDYIRESLSILQINHRFLEEKSFAHVDKIIYADHVAPTGNYDEDLINLVRNKLISQSDVSMDLGERIYVSRSKARKRKVANEEKILPVLKSAGFNIINNEDFKWLEQLALMKNAKVFMSVHGAGLTNMLYMQPESKVLEIRNETNRYTNCYFSMASALKFDYYIVPGKAKNIFRIDRNSPDLILNPNVLEKVIEEALG